MRATLGPGWLQATVGLKQASGIWLLASASGGLRNRGLFGFQQGLRPLASSNKAVSSLLENPSIRFCYGVSLSLCREFQSLNTYFQTSYSDSSWGLEKKIIIWSKIFDVKCFAECLSIWIYQGKPYHRRPEIWVKRHTNTQIFAPIKG